MGAELVGEFDPESAAGGADAAAGNFSSGRLQLLETDDVRRGLFQPAQKLASRPLTPLTLKIDILK